MEDITLGTARTIEKIKLCLDRGDDINEGFGKRERSAFISACKKGKLDFVKFLVINNCDVYTEDYWGDPGFIYVCHKGWMDIFEFLIDKTKIDINLRNSRNQTGLMIACISGQIDIVKQLLKLGANFNIMDQSGKQAIHYAAKGGILEIIDLLIVYGANLNFQDNDGWSPLHYTVLNNEYDVIKRLLEISVDTKLKDDDGKTALMVAIKYKKKGIVSLFEEFGIFE